MMYMVKIISEFVESPQEGQNNSRGAFLRLYKGVRLTEGWSELN